MSVSGNTNAQITTPHMYAYIFIHIYVPFYVYILIYLHKCIYTGNNNGNTSAHFIIPNTTPTTTGNGKEIFLSMYICLYMNHHYYPHTCMY